TDPTKFESVKAALAAAKLELIDSDVKNLPKTFANVEVEIGKKVVRLIDALDNNDDVQMVYTNANLTDEMTA
ncbi:MAG: YebC/PmpR family DNA-binding transcriptional regulator, partial [Gemmataceae bacterium]